ncbi:MAG: hypothetical protein JOS17DRAFT_777340 [Linnemannia elongata]|nr:MAG: hypothetical protein JOS17DRAFT_777340 [Linnemannia elongata]
MPEPVCDASSPCSLSKEKRALWQMQECRSGSGNQSVDHHQLNRGSTPLSPLSLPLSDKPEGSDSGDISPPLGLVATTLNQIMASVGHIVDTVVQLGEQFTEQTEYIGRINRQLGAQIERIGWIEEQGKWWVAQVDGMKRQNARLEGHAESIQGDMDRAVECLTLLLQDQRKIREESDGAREGLRRAGDTEQNPIYLD